MTGGAKTGRVWYCDALRVLAIAFVVLLHALADGRIAYFGTSRTCYFILTCAQVITRVAVPIFFMLTGTLLLGRKREERYTTFLKTRVLKLFVPFMIVSGIYYVVNICQSGMPASGSLWKFLVAFSNDEIKYHFWFMYVILTIYLLLPLLNKLVLNLSQRNLRDLILVLACGNLVNAITYVSQSLGTPILMGWEFPDLICYINYLFLGYYLSHYGIPKEWRKWLYLAGIGALILMPILNIVTVKTVLADNLFMPNSIGPLIASAAFFVAFQSTHWKWGTRWKRFLSLTAPIVFYIYMMHVMVMDFVKHNLLKIWVPQHFVEVCGFIAIEFLLAFGVSYVVALGMYSCERACSKRRKIKS